MATHIFKLREGRNQRVGSSYWWRYDYDGEKITFTGKGVMICVDFPGGTGKKVGLKTDGAQSHFFRVWAEEHRKYKAGAHDASPWIVTRPENEIMAQYIAGIGGRSGAVKLNIYPYGCTIRAYVVDHAVKVLAIEQPPYVAGCKNRGRRAYYIAQDATAEMVREAMK